MLTVVKVQNLEKLTQERTELVKKVNSQAMQIDLLTNCTTLGKVVDTLRKQNTQLEKDGCEMVTALQFIQKEVKNLNYILSLVDNEITKVLEVKT